LPTALHERRVDTVAEILACFRMCGIVHGMEPLSDQAAEFLLKAQDRGDGSWCAAEDADDDYARFRTTCIAFIALRPRRRSQRTAPAERSMYAAAAVISEQRTVQAMHHLMHARLCPLDHSTKSRREPRSQVARILASQPALSFPLSVPQAELLRGLGVNQRLDVRGRLLTEKVTKQRADRRAEAASKLEAFLSQDLRFGTPVPTTQESVEQFEPGKRLEDYRHAMRTPFFVKLRRTYVRRWDEPSHASFAQLSVHSADFAALHKSHRPASSSFPVRPPRPTSTRASTPGLDANGLAGWQLEQSARPHSAMAAAPAGSARSVQRPASQATRLLGRTEEAVPHSRAGRADLLRTV
jgi:hypothetical protein